MSQITGRIGDRWRRLVEATCTLDPPNYGGHIQSNVAIPTVDAMFQSVREVVIVKLTSVVHSRTSFQNSQFVHQSVHDSVAQAMFSHKNFRELRRNTTLGMSRATICAPQNNRKIIR